MRKSLKYFNVIIDNPVFVMHYGAIAFLLILFSLLVSLQPKNESVSCFPKDDIPPKFLEAFCWMHPIYAKDNSTLKTDSRINSPMPRFAPKETIWYMMMTLGFPYCFFFCPLHSACRDFSGSIWNLERYRNDYLYCAIRPEAAKKI
ncbi:hypothetical protein CEXT_611731 [Caerostris extrusa]|uniref:Innexin n=1 Tax=Caerostris extrusa TaxID=172846 RepID=A0AAV4M8M4_CAEEX|nr:hypothetical protein CEXT_611731 [Caerostris extrusa]